MNFNFANGFRLLFYSLVYFWPVYASIFIREDELWGYLRPLPWHSFTSFFLYFTSITFFSIFLGSIYPNSLKNYDIKKDFSNDGFWGLTLVFLILPVFVLVAAEPLDFLSNWWYITDSMRLIFATIFFIFLYQLIKWIQINILEFTAEEGVHRIASMGFIMGLVFLVTFFVIRPDSRAAHTTSVNYAVVEYNNSVPTQDGVNKIKERLNAAKRDMIQFDAFDIAKTISASGNYRCQRAVYERYTKLTGHDITAAGMFDSSSPEPGEKCISEDNPEFDQKALRLFSVVKSLCQERLIKCR